jgi:bis(5'-nucleosyl)-tetraphosphatase (symmetrical)
MTARHFVIGDLQGCFASLEQLLTQIEFQAGIDHIYLLGDIVNRGPQSLACLRWAANTPNVISVLGNHDLHLLAVASGNPRYHKSSDTIQDILDADDKTALLDWLRNQPLIIHLPAFDTVLVHAGVPPQWSLKKALAMAQKVESELQADDWMTFTGQHLYGNTPNHWSKSHDPIEQLRYTVNVFARMRLCSISGELEFKHKLGSQKRPPGFAPWFDYPRDDQPKTRFLFGHWSTIGLTEGAHSLCLDTGCLWGGTLSALCLETQTLTQIPCPSYADPEKVT